MLKVIGIWDDRSDSNVIFNNTLYNNTIGIFLQGINHTISGNLIYDNVVSHAVGIFTGGLFSNSRIINNTIFNNAAQGMFILESNNINIINNTVYGNGLGLDFVLNTGFNIIGNEIHSNQEYGIFLEDRNTDFWIERNTIQGNLNGILFLQPGDTLVGRNQNITLKHNLIVNNDQGVVIDVNNTDHTIINNDFANNLNGNLIDDGINNLFTGNYFDDWDGLFVYEISGLAENQDLEPQSNPNHISSLSLIIDDGVSLVLMGSILISWNSVSDTFAHSLTYSFFYSPNGGTAWVLIEEGLSSTNYNLDTSTLTDGSDYLFKVQGIDEIGFVTETVTSETYTIGNAAHELSLSLNNPSGTQTGTISLSWDEATDTWGHELVYDVYYSSDDGTTWKLLVNDLTDTSFDWDTTTVENGNYLIKVVAKDVDGSSVEAFSLVFVVENVEETTISATSVDGISSSSPLGETSAEGPSNLALSGIFFAGLVFAVTKIIRKRKY